MSDPKPVKWYGVYAPDGSLYATRPTSKEAWMRQGLTPKDAGYYVRPVTITPDTESEKNDE